MGVLLNNIFYLVFGLNLCVVDAYVCDKNYPHCGDCLPGHYEMRHDSYDGPEASNTLTGAII